MTPSEMVRALLNFIATADLSVPSQQRIYREVVSSLECIVEAAPLAFEAGCNCRGEISDEWLVQSGIITTHAISLVVLINCALGKKK